MAGTPLHRSGLVALLVMLLLGATVAGCGSGDGGGDPGQSSDTISEVTVAAGGEAEPGGTLVYGLEAETDGWDPLASRWAASGLMVANAVFDPLVVWNEDLEPVPYLAAELRPDPDFMAWEITLRDGIEFHDGTPLDANALELFLQAQRDSPLLRAAAGPVRAVKQLDDGLTVRVEMSTPWAAYPAILTAQGGMVMSPETIGTPEAQEHPIGTGPFKFDRWERNASLRVVKNDDYWRDGLPYLDSVEFRPIPDVQSRVQSLRAGDIDALHLSDPAGIGGLRDLAEDGDIQITYSQGEVEEAVILLNHDEPPVDDVRIRRAMAHALDREGFNEVAGVPADQTAYGPFREDSPWYVETDYPRYDPEEARRLVEAYEAEHGPAKVTLRSTNVTSTISNAQFVAEAFNLVGIDATVESVEQTTLISDALAGNYVAQSWRQFGSQDPDGEWVWWHSSMTEPPIPLNMARLRDDAVDDALDRGRRTDDPEARRQAYADLQERFAEQVPYIFLYHATWAVGTQNNVRSIVGGELPDGGRAAGLVGGVHRLTQVWIDR